MKKIINKMVLATVILIAISGCSQKYTHLDKKEVITSLDFTKYQKNNFLITPGDYGEDYEALGMFSFTIYPEANFVKNTKDKNSHLKMWKQETIFPQDVLDLAYKTALTKGANAITHFKIKSAPNTKHDGIQYFNIIGLEISGLLIKRKFTE